MGIFRGMAVVPDREEAQKPVDLRLQNVAREAAEASGQL
jgi:hypothetical protein